MVNMLFFGKSLSDYLLPVKGYVIGSVLIVLSQYLIGLQVQDEFPLFLNLTQLAWALMIIFSLYKLIKRYDFSFKNVLFTGLLFSIIIHGLKITIRFVFYGKDFYYLVDRFTYGSLLVFIITIPTGLAFLYLKRKKQL